MKSVGFYPSISHKICTKGAVVFALLISDRFRHVFVWLRSLIVARNNMNSYIRRTPITADQVHSFLKDKQAWENAIAMYQGPDPLDHWYNYICWYENSIHGDPENKFRETLERCLTLYEHSEYYKQDPRMVRLWVKYIDMQQNPLHFYQILYQRGVGRQCADFYVNWARYYESINALKEADSVFSLAFQEKAQPFIELQTAHSKLLYLRTAAVVATTAPVEKLPQQELTQQSSPVALQQKLHEQFHYEQQQQHQLQHSAQQQHQNQHHHHHQIYQQQASYQRVQHQMEHLQQPQQQMHYQQHSPQPDQHVHYEPQNASDESQQSSSARNTETQIHVYGGELRTGPAAELVSAEQQQEHLSAPMLKQNHTTEVESVESKLCVSETSVKGVKLPRRFASLCRNNFELWKPALFLEEPADPNRRCHYAKQIVYPGNGVEYSPEELRAKKWETHLQELKRQAQPSYEDQEKHKSAELLHETNSVQHTQEVYYSHQNYPQETCLKSQNQTENLAPEEENDDETTYEEDEKTSEGAIQPNTANRATVAHIANDLEDQIEASTIRFSTHTAQGVKKNQSIKIVFKKENRRTDDSQNGLNYSSYTIDSSYIPQETKFVGSPASHQNTSRSNGHSFHPYDIGQTSTPKTSSKRIKTKLKIVNKMHAVACSNSNSSSADYSYNGKAGMPSEHSTQMPSHPVNESAVHNASFNDNANFSFSSAAALDNSNCSVASGVARLNFRDTTATNAVDFSTFNENSYFATQHDDEAKEQRLKKALQTIERHLAKEAVDPFNSELCRAFLTKLDFPGTEDSSANYKITQIPLPKMQNTRTLSLPDGVQFNVDKEVGRGSYGSVYKASDAKTGAVVALKYQKPPNTWEIYICDQVLKRIKSPQVLPGLMDISTAIIAPNASIIATEFSPFGSLLDVNNKIRQATTKVMHESLVMHFSSQICHIIHHLHKNKIIHADIKPDNFLLMRVPSTDLYYPSLRLIDFGCAIDLTLFPHPDITKFRKVIQTDGFTCVEMQEGRPWSYETDLFCIAGTVHVMLFGEYMQLQKRGGCWDIKQKLPRYLKKHVWTKFFGGMLNMNGAELPDLNEMRTTFDEEAAKMDSELQNQIRTLSNILHRR